MNAQPIELSPTELEGGLALDAGAAPASSLRPPGLRLDAYLNLMKPRIVALLLLTTLAAMVIATRGLPSLPLILATLVGGGLVAGGAGAFNHYLDRDIDDLMYRTSRRPVASGLIRPEQAVIFALTVTVGGLLLLVLLVNPLAAALSLAGHVHYVLVYSRLLKRVTPQNIVLGGAAGAIAPLVGWAAVTGTLDASALYLFAVIFFWTPPHFWALAILMKGDYARAGIPMLPVVRGDQETKRQIFLYSVQLVAVTLLLVPAGAMGAVYLVLALLLGGIFVRYAVKLIQDTTTRGARVLFRYSILYLALLFAAMVLDRTTGAL